LYRIHQFQRKTTVFIKLKQNLMGSAAGKVMEVPDSEGQSLIDKGIAYLAGDALSLVISKAMEIMTEKLMFRNLDGTLDRLARGRFDRGPSCAISSAMRGLRVAGRPGAAWLAAWEAPGRVGPGRQLLSRPEATPRRPIYHPITCCTADLHQC
jgi:hypothetical protein